MKPHHYGESCTDNSFTGNRMQILMSVQVAHLKLVLRARGITYTSTSKKSELLDLLTWAIDSEATKEVPVSSISPAVFPETYDWDQLIVGQSDAESLPEVTEGAHHEGRDEGQSSERKHPAVPEATGNQHAARAAAQSKAADLKRQVEGLTGARVQTGTQHLGRIATAAEAAREKELAGENRAVEHVALYDSGVSPDSKVDGQEDAEGCNLVRSRLPARRCSKIASGGKGGQKSVGGKADAVAGGKLPQKRLRQMQDVDLKHEDGVDGSSAMSKGFKQRKRRHWQ
jgi:hypothetical protein